MSDTHIRWLGPRHVHLVSGSLYVDTHGTSTFDVDTDQGRVRDVGTRYLVQADTGTTSVVVREGEVEVETKQSSVTARGDGVTAQVVGVAGLGLSVKDEPASSQRWAWILEVAPDYPEAGVRVLLDRICADLGKRLVFESPGVEAAVANLSLSTGSLSGTDPELALEALVRSSGLGFTQNSTEVRLRF
jgi:hypothetical protein